MTKPQIFIGSSGESLPVVEQLKAKLVADFECVSWNENFFDVNKSTYDNLIQKSICFDYAIFVGGKDDKVFRMSKRTEKTGVRDNVYLELGLYSGVLSHMRNYFVVHKDCAVASDYFGITVFQYDDTNDSVEECCKKLIKCIKAEENNSRITLLPANTLAFGYYENFLKPASQLLYEMDIIEVDQVAYDVRKFAKQLKVVFPNDVSVSWDSWAAMYYRESELCEILLKGSVKNISVYLDKKALCDRNEVIVVDVPQTLRSSFQCVDLFVNDGTFNDTQIQRKVKEKEVRNFAKTLRKLVLKDAYSAKIVNVM